MTTRGRRLRSGYTLVELVVASASSMLLLAGMGGSIYFASQALDPDDSKTHKTNQAGIKVNHLMSEMGYATRFYERTPHAVTFAIPDRDGDGSEEKFRYAWSGVPGDPLTKELNGSAPSVLVKDIHGINFTYMTRSVIAPPPVVVAREVVFEEFTETILNPKSNSLTIAKPSGVVAGDLLIASVAVQNDMSSSLSAPVDWNTIDVGHESGKVTLGVWWKIAGASESSSYEFTWSNDMEAYGVIMRFSGHDPTTPIDVFTASGDNSDSPTSPAVTTTVDNTMTLRLGGFKKGDITVDSPGLSGHTAITMDRSGSSKNSCSGGAGYILQPTTGDSGTSSFTLTNSHEARLVTIAIAPAPLNRLANDMTSRIHRRNGMTLVEVMISTLLVGMVLVAAMNTVGGVFKTRNVAAELEVGPALARNLMSEVLQNAFTDPEDPNDPIGNDSGESNGSREDFDDVDDFDGWDESSPENADKSPLGYGDGWQRQVAVAFVNPDTMTPAGSDTGLKLITVTVTPPTGSPTIFQALRSRLGSVERPPPHSTGLL